MGGAQLGSMPELFGYEVTEDAAIDLVRQVMDGPIRFLDTSNGYGGGRSEERIGRAIDQHGGLPADFVISTKVDALDGDYSGARVRTSVRESMERLGIGRLPIVFLHDPEFHSYEMITAPGGAVDALVELRAAGEIGHIGVAGGDTREISRYVDLGVFDAVLVHNRWTLVDRSAGPLFEQAVAAGMAVVNAAVYGGGLLTASGGNGNYAYRPARPGGPRGGRGDERRLRRWGTDLATAALQFSLRDDRIASTVTGFTKRSTLSRTLRGPRCRPARAVLGRDRGPGSPARSTGSTTTHRSSGDRAAVSQHPLGSGVMSDPTGRSPAAQRAVLRRDPQRRPRSDPIRGRDQSHRSGPPLRADREDDLRDREVVDRVRRRHRVRLRAVDRGKAPVLLRLNDKQLYAVGISIDVARCVLVRLRSGRHRAGPQRDPRQRNRRSRPRC